MKTLKAICAAAILALAVTVPAYADAGQVETPGLTSPPPPPASNITVTTETTSDLSDTTTSGFADLLWVLVSIL
jgi:hypothetical protein